VSDPVNYGITGNVKAKAVAVGTGAQASVRETLPPQGQEEFLAAIHDLLAQLAALRLSPAAHELVRADTDQLRQLAPGDKAAAPQALGILDRLTQKLKMADVALEAAAPLGKAMKAVAAIFGVPLPF